MRWGPGASHWGCEDNDENVIPDASNEINVEKVDAPDGKKRKRERIPTKKEDKDKGGEGKHHNKVKYVGETSRSSY